MSRQHSASRSAELSWVVSTSRSTGDTAAVAAAAAADADAAGGMTHLSPSIEFCCRT